jgi:serine/threonine protein kinase
MIGKSILNYEILSLIGEGGMGSVFLAKHSQVERIVAIKSLLPQFMSNNEIKQRFKNEASTLARLQHANIVGLFDYFEDESGMYLIMEFVEGMALDEFIRDVTGPMPEERAVPIINGILEAFSYAHQQNIIHRDIKPANIIITKDDKVKILDFGIARLLGDSNHNLTKTGTQMGTVYYMSPEQVQGKKVDIRSDIYSLGVTFYQMLTGVNPYSGLTTEYEVYSKIVKEDLAPPQEIYPGIPLYLSTILKKALEKNPEDRFQSCEEFLAAIKSKVKVESKPIVNSVASKQETIKQRQIPIQNNNLSNGAATAGLVLGIIGLVFSFIPYASFVGVILCFLAIIFGSKGNSNIRENEELKFSKGNSKAGLTMGVIGLIISLIVSSSVLYNLNFKDSSSETIMDSDSDGDGFIDSEDNCPNEAGFSEYHGCPIPDSDMDGVLDDSDQCVNESGPTENYGCPWPDTDGDGVLDKYDACPEIYGENSDGCQLEGTHLFWFDANINGKWKGNVSIYVDDVYVGEINNWYDDNPGCYATGCVTIAKAPGTYRWSAHAANGGDWEGDTFEIISGECGGGDGLYLY